MQPECAPKGWSYQLELTILEVVFATRFRIQHCFSLFKVQKQQAIKKKKNSINFLVILIGYVLFLGWFTVSFSLILSIFMSFSHFLQTNSLIYLSNSICMYLFVSILFSQFPFYFSLISHLFTFLSDSILFFCQFSQFFAWFFMLNSTFFCLFPHFFCTIPHFFCPFPYIFFRIQCFFYWIQCFIGPFQHFSGSIP